MKLRHTNGPLFAALVGSVLLVSTGCQSGMFSKPDLGRLAFWKKENLQLASRTSEIPPPSSHFSPDTKDGNDDTKKQIEASIAKMAQGAKQKSEQSNGLIRKPYSLDSIDPQIAPDESTPAAQTASKSQNSDLSRKLNQLQSASDEAVRAAGNALQQTESQMKDSARLLADLKKQMQGNAQQTLKGASESVRAGAGQVVDATTEAVNQFTGTTAGAVNQTVSNVKQSVDNSFQPMRTASSSAHVANPYAAVSTKTSSNQFGGGSIARNKTAAVQSSASTSIDSPMTSSVQQSSFNSEDEHSGGGLLQPAVPGQTAAGSQGSDATTATSASYPQTPHGDIRPVQGTASTASSDIPAQLLQGSSSFAPGSTVQLKPAESAR